MTRAVRRVAADNPGDPRFDTRPSPDPAGEAA
ncbi:hypothetical protein BJ968_003877 [Kineococcus aurantiacus]|uniref:Uncharacterized protein n=1 Tax=Kineococcus aurantiacus TaxID=37633 RepID=A0A7Y9J2J9_9ACTN|nr:hypothetical protein [Kineococcus aurantiacus]